MTSASPEHLYANGAHRRTRTVPKAPTYFFFGLGGLVPVGDVVGFSEPAFATPDVACRVRIAGALYAAFLRKSLLFGSCLFAMSPSHIKLTQGGLILYE